jgi:hypothetical protein
MQGGPMLMDGKIKNSIAGVLGSGVHHSRYYHRRYEGWMERSIEKGDGKKRIERVYVGEYYSQDLSDGQRLLFRFLYSALYIFSLSFFLFASIRFTGSNRTFAVQFICFLTLLAMVAMLVFLFAYVLSPKRLTVWEYYAGPLRVRIFSFIIALLIGGSAMAVLIYLLAADNANVQSELANIAVYGTAAVLMFIIHRMEKNIPYKVTPAVAKEMRSGYYID